MKCPNCQQECDQAENQYYSFSHVRMSCDNFNCPAIKKTGFKFIFDYRKHRQDILAEKTIDYKTVYEIISLNFLFEYEGHWYLFSQANAPARYTIYYFSEERRRGQQWGTFKELTSSPQHQVSINPNTLQEDVMAHFHRIMKLKAFL